MVKKANNLKMGLPVAAARFMLFEHPLLLLAGIWVLLLLIATTAARGLINPGGELHQAEETSIAATTFEEPLKIAETAPLAETTPIIAPSPIIATNSITVSEVSTSDKGKPPWLYGAIALGLLGGSGLAYLRLQQTTQLSRRRTLRSVSASKKSSLNPPVSRRRARQESKRDRAASAGVPKSKPTVAAAMATSGHREMQIKSKTPVAPKRNPTTPLRPPAASNTSSRMNSAPTRRREPGSRTPEVTVIPPSRSRRRSRKVNNSIDRLDMRQRQPLNDWQEDRYYKSQAR
jgi:hypothetical protein